ncbi:hypothetical protein Tco_0790806 [Tanacetum coccineum]
MNEVVSNLFRATLFLPTDLQWLLYHKGPITISKAMNVESTPHIRAPVDDTHELFGDDQSTDSKESEDEESGEQTTSSQEEEMGPSLLTMQLKFDSVIPDDVLNGQEASLLDEEDGEEDVELIDDDEEDEEREESPGAARLDSKKAKELIANIFNDKDEDFLSSNDEETEKILAKERVLNKAMSDSLCFFWDTLYVMSNFLSEAHFVVLFRGYYRKRHSMIF